MTNDKIFENKNNLLYVKEELKPNNIDMVFTTRLDGVSINEYSSLNLGYQVQDDVNKVWENRQILANKLNYDINSFVSAGQTHGVNAYKVTQADMGKGNRSYDDGIEDVDCLYTFEKNIPLACFYADCTPIYFYEEESGIIGIIHSGWQGTVHMIVGKVMEKLAEEENINIPNVKLIIGPSIKKDSFEVEADVKDQFNEYNNYDLDKVIFEGKQPGKYFIDTDEFNIQTAIKNGVSKDNILVSQIDTFKEEDLFSFRRDNVTGRMMAVICQK